MSTSDSDAYESISSGSASFNLSGSQALLALRTYAEIFPWSSKLDFLAILEERDFGNE